MRYFYLVTFDDPDSHNRYQGRMLFQTSTNDFGDFMSAFADWRDRHWLIEHEISRVPGCQYKFLGTDRQVRWKSYFSSLSIKNRDPLADLPYIFDMVFGVLFTAKTNWKERWSMKDEAGFVVRRVTYQTMPKAINFLTYGGGPGIREIHQWFRMAVREARKGEKMEKKEREDLRKRNASRYDQGRDRIEARCVKVLKAVVCALTDTKGTEARKAWVLMMRPKFD
ncbi:hypothetical protein MKZ38_002588 [Zalerion maritima]|uniref:Uncharacterized protein n=1 Tax=Zalerion maritima TaxID=339359 RepID=A0AAD5WS99_9PEZI|nr:hypothetical protein MKZ38_002588 [Zalerion maritima]